MADFSLTTMFVVPSGVTIASSGSTQNLTAGKLGVFLNTYAVATSGTVAAAPYFYIAQGRTNTYLQGTKRSDKIKGCLAGTPCNSNITEWYKVTGCGTPAVQITDVTGWNVKCGDIVTLTLRAHSSYLQTLYFNGFTRSVTVQAPCCDCGGSPCDTADVNALINQFIVKLTDEAPGANFDNITLNDFYTFANVDGTTLRITGKALTEYGQPCDVSAFPHEYDRMWFYAFVYSGPATTADFIVADNCNIVAEAAVIQRSSYATGTSAEIKQLEKNYYSYQAGYMKHLYKMAGYNPNFESWVTDDAIYTTFYIKFNELDKSAYNWGDYIPEDQMVIIAVVTGSQEQTDLEAILEAANGDFVDDNACITTTTTTSTSSTTTTSTTLALRP
jgi:hypothetical protein